MYVFDAETAEEMRDEILQLIGSKIASEESHKFLAKKSEQGARQARINCLSGLLHDIRTAKIT